jgi:hypothetical protein
MYANLVPIDRAATDAVCDAALDTVFELDRIFFDRHPHRQIYARWMMPDELGVVVVEEGCEPLVIVTNLGPGLRLRKPHAVTADRAHVVLRMSEHKLRREWSRESRGILAFGPGLTAEGRMLVARRQVTA